jgi:flavin-dependent dehydrogenase
MWDVLVVGGGPAGSAAALALQQRGARVLLIERAQVRTAHPGESLPGEGLTCLDELGVREPFSRLSSRPCYLHRVHWAGKHRERPALATPSGPTHQLDRVAFDDMLLAECERRGLSVKRGCTLKRLDCHSPRVLAELSDAGTTLHMECRAVIDATGRSAQVCRRLGAKRERADRLIAFGATFDRGDCEPSSLIESSAAGWWYTAPRPEGLLTALYLTELSGTPQLVQKPESIWSAALEQAPATRVRIAQRTRRSVIQGYRAGPEWTHFDPALPVLPVGDAVLSFDPISGEGLCFALRSGIEAAKALGSATIHRRYRDGARSVYESHLREREAGYAVERPLRNAAFWARPRHLTIERMGVRAPATGAGAAPAAGEACTLAE